MFRSLRQLCPQSLVIVLAVLISAAFALSVDVPRLDASDGGTLRALEAQAESGIRYQATEPAGAPEDGSAAVLDTSGSERGTANITAFIWDDLDEDGRQDAGEPGLSGVTVRLYDSNKTTILDTAISSASGNAVLQATTPGSYRIRVILPGASDAFSPKDNPSAGSALDSDIYASGRNFGYSDTMTLTAQMTTITSYDAGIIRFRTATPTRTPTPVNFGNFVWDDLDKDGRQDSGEPGLEGVIVQLWNGAMNDLIDATQTNASGIYSLQSPGPGQYRIRVLLSVGDSFSPENAAGGDDTKDSDINNNFLLSTYGYTDIIDVASNVISITSIDAGVIKLRTATPTRTPTPINVGNFVWNDKDADGIQDANEVGLSGIVVQLWNADMDLMYSQTTTNANGIYTLVAPTPGDYRVRVIKPVGSSYSPKNAGGDDNKDSDITTSILSSAYGFTSVYTFASNLISITTIDAGLINVPATQVPSITPSKTPTRTPTNTPTNTTTPLEGVDTLAVYGKQEQKFSLIDTLADKPPGTAYTKFTSNAPVKGSFVMGDWNNDGQRTPGLFNEGFFWYTNTIGAGATWSQVWTGLAEGKFAPVAGRFSFSHTNDCIGLVHKNFDGPSDGFPMYYTCELSQVNPPSGMLQQWLTVTLPGPGKYQFVAGDFNADNYDSVAVRRGDTFAWSNTVPEVGTASLTIQQDFGDPYQKYGWAVAGDWNSNGVDTFALYFHDRPRFYFRNDLNPGFSQPARQRLKNKVGGKPYVDSWYETVEIRGSNAPIPLPDAPSQPEQQQPPALSPTLTPTPSYIAGQLETPTPTATADAGRVTETLEPSLPPSVTQLPTLPPTNTVLPSLTPTRTQLPPEFDGTPGDTTG